jgi:hypothetical protein
MEDRNQYLQQLADLKTTSGIRFRDVSGAVSEIRARIIRYDEVAGRGMIETDAGLTIGADQLIEVNGRQFENYC